MGEGCSFTKKQPKGLYEEMASSHKRRILLFVLLSYLCVVTSANAWKQENEADCWPKCGSKGGSCPKFCGVGGFCCRIGYGGCPDGAAEASPKHHTCVTRTDEDDCVTDSGVCVFPFTY